MRSAGQRPSGTCSSNTTIIQAAMSQKRGSSGASGRVGVRLDGLSSHAPRLGDAVEPVLHTVEYVLVLPALDAPQLGRRAPGSERTGEAGAQVVVEVEVVRVIRGSSI